MAATETIFQYPIFKSFILPFLLVFAVVFAILEKTKVLGEDKKQVNAIVSFVIGLIFVSAAYPKQVVENLILFVVVGIIIIFVFLLLYGFVVSDNKDGFKVEKWMKWVFGILAGIAVIIAVVWAAGFEDIFDFLFEQNWSSDLWTNFIFVVFIIAVIVIVLSVKKKE